MLDRLGPDLWAYGVLVVMLIIAATTDVCTGKIYNWLTYPVLFVAIVGHTLFGGIGGQAMEEGPRLMGLTDSLLGFAVGFVPLLVAWLMGGIGGGDAKLMGAVGALVGWPFALSSLMYGLVVLLIMAFGIMIARRITKDTFKRIGHFLYLAMAKAKPGSPATEESPTVPFGLALCIGTAIALVLAIFFDAGRTAFIIL